VRVGAQAGLESEVLDVHGDVEGEPLASGPGVVLALVDRQEFVALVVRELQHGGPRSMFVVGDN
jgi:hypothetical protein